MVQGRAFCPPCTPSVTEYKCYQLPTIWRNKAARPSYLRGPEVNTKLFMVALARVKTSVYAIHIKKNYL